MANLINPAALSVVVTAVLDFQNGKTYNLSKAVTVATIVEAAKEIYTVPVAAETEIWGLSGALNDRGAFTDFDFLMVVNQDDTNFCRIRLSKNGAETADFRLDPGQVMLFWNKAMDVDAAEGAFAAFVDIDMLSAQADTAAVQLEFMICKT